MFVIAFEVLDKQGPLNTMSKDDPVVGYEFDPITVDYLLVLSSVGQKPQMVSSWSRIPQPNFQAKPAQPQGSLKST